MEEGVSPCLFCKLKCPFNHNFLLKTVVNDNSPTKFRTLYVQLRGLRGLNMSIFQLRLQILNRRK